MTKDCLLKTLADLRQIHMSLWEEYHEKAGERKLFHDMRDYYERNVRVLDYLMEAIRHDAI